MSQPNAIRLRGVRQNNLKNIDVDIPLGKYIAVTGLSGAGKSSLVFETLHAEGQRRYVETFSSYTRQFLDLLEKPDLDSAENIRPSIAIEQKNTIKTSRSTVGTMTELCDFFKVWFSHIAELHDPDTGEIIRDDNPQTIWLKASHSWPEQTAIIAFQVKRPEKLKWDDILKNVKAQGYSRFIDSTGTITKLEEATLDENSDDSIFIIQDRVKLADASKARFLEATETAFEFGQGKLTLFDREGKVLHQYSRGLCSSDGSKHYRPASPAMFSFNSPIGACPKCRGFGRVIEIDYRLAIPDTNLSIEQGLIKPFDGQVYGESKRDLMRACRRLKISIKKPFNQLSAKQQEIILEGEDAYRHKTPEDDWDGKAWYGVKGFFRWLEKNTYKMHVRIFLSRYRAYIPCPDCGASRLQPESLCWKWNDYRLPDLYQLPISKLLPLIESASQKTHNSQLTPHNSDRRSSIAYDSIISRLRYLSYVGLGYLTLDRPARTLSGGEVERVNLTSCLGSALVDTLFVLDEPSVGLHARDIDRLIHIVRTLTEAGNTVVVVEHDDAMIQAADEVIEIGPEPGAKGGYLQFQGSVAQLRRSSKSITGQYLKGKLALDPPNKTRSINAKTPKIELRGICKHNIDNLDVSIPLGKFVCFSGVSGSGKSTILNNALYQNVIADSGKIAEEPAKLESMNCPVEFEEIVMVDQSPVSRTPRSNPAVFINAWDQIRKLYGTLPEAQASGYTPSSFSFNAGDGRCNHCNGLGYEKVEMQFLSDVFVPCPHCDSKRFKSELLEIQYKTLNVSQILDLTIEQAIHHFDDQPKITDKLKSLETIGLGYLKMGQPLNTLSGGESQRLKLVKYLSNSPTLRSSPLTPNSSTRSLILLDEPTTGLHKHDVKRLLAALQSIVDQGHSLIVIEHNMDVLKSADWIIEIGPEAGQDGGKLVFQGTPRECSQETKLTETGRYLAGEFAKQTPTSKYESDLSDSSKLLAAEKPAAYHSSSELTTDSLTVIGARENNLQNINVSIPHYQFSVVTGVSGSGKSTLAFDIVFGEGQRRFMESMSPYARQFVEQLPRPDLDHISGIQPTVAIEQRITRGSRKSTVATITEVAQYLRLLYSRLGVPHSITSGNPLVAQSERQLLKRLQSLLESSSAQKSKTLYLCAPLIRNRKGHHQPIATWIENHGYERMRVDGKLIKTENFEKLDRYSEHNIEVVIADLKQCDSPSTALKEALQRGKGACFLLENKKLSWFSTRSMDPETGESLPELDPKDFSFNSSKGWCPTCRGHGRIYPWMRERLEDEEELAKAIGANDEDDDEVTVICHDCQGERLNPVSRNVRLYLKNGDSPNLPQLLNSEPKALLEKLDKLKLDKRGAIIARDIISQIQERLKFMDKVGLEYLTLDRPTQTLSGGEAQRIRLASQLGSNLAGVLYVLDEPSIGLHARDGDRLIETLKSLKDKGNTLLVVEHDDATMEHADYIIDLGPGAGIKGGQLIGEGTLKDLKNKDTSLTGAYLKNGITHPLNGSYRTLPKATQWIELTGVNFRNLKKQSVKLPHQKLSMICGASGAGKSSLIRDLLSPAASYSINKKKESVTGKDFCKNGQNIEGEEGNVLFEKLTGASTFRSVIEVDQSPIGKTPRSTPATYLGAFDIIRTFFANLPESKIRGYKPGRFSFNTPHGRCDTCSGAGRVKLEMSFMPDTYVTCEDCNGTRYSQELLDLHWKGKNIADVLQMSFEEAVDFFDFHSQLSQIMQLMVETGLGYLSLGQSSPTLSGGEAQRMKLVSELTKGLQSYTERSRNIQRQNLYILEEPTIGLHLSDCEKLIRLLHKLVDQGHTVVVIEHHLDLLAEADYIVEVGPDGGPKGGKILSQGNLTKLLKSKRSITAPYLNPKLKMQGIRLAQ
ncbi:excinuclease ABC subunit UvrA [Puniceicoccaceae bacterium K14]|nr:excinuclease ABC subunit UvrA [Puniceicoccaceae bacterium K14]